MASTRADLLSSTFCDGHYELQQHILKVEVVDWPCSIAICQCFFAYALQSATSCMEKVYKCLSLGSTEWAV